MPMRTRTLASLMLSSVLLMAAAIMQPAFARGPGGPPGFAGPPAGAPPSWQGSYPPGFGMGNKTGWNGRNVPPGWLNTKGKRKGWHGHAVPPGLYGR
jgi:hypothetical protein